jgi:predicted DsbA family dithiol-disulfide isomerase
VSLPVRLYTDFVCPFCYIAEQSTVPRLVREFDVELEWHGFELHPSTPPGGVPLTTLFPGVDLRVLHERTQRFAASFGVVGFEPPNWLHNTRRALAVAERARDLDRLDEFRDAAFDAHWRRGKDLESTTDLAEIAASVGIDADVAVAAADDPELLSRVDARQTAARNAGVSGIPTFQLGSIRVTGCQPFEVLAEAARRAGASRRQ